MNNQLGFYKELRIAVSPVILWVMDSVSLMGYVNQFSSTVVCEVTHFGAILGQNPNTTICLSAAMCFQSSRVSSLE